MDEQAGSTDPRIELEAPAEVPRSRTRLTVRRLMVLMAIVALVFYGGLLGYRLLVYPRQAEACRQLAEMFEDAGKTQRAFAERDPSNAESHRALADSFDRKAEFFRDHEARFRENALRPWVDLPRPGPTPD